jgi:hypothetical protein
VEQVAWSRPRWERSAHPMTPRPRQGSRGHGGRRGQQGQRHDERHEVSLRKWQAPPLAATPSGFGPAPTCC